MALSTPPSLPEPAPPPLASAHATSPQPKRRRGGQPYNLNARKDGAYSILRPGPLYEARRRVDSLLFESRSGLLPSQVVLDLARAERKIIESIKKQHNVGTLATVRMEIKLSKLIFRSIDVNLPYILKVCALEKIAHDPFGWIEGYIRAFDIARDADSFFPVSKLSVRNSLILPSPNVLTSYSQSIWGGAGEGLGGFATNLTDEQWAVLAPLIPPDPATAWQSGEPPVIIAASRWGLTPYAPTGEFGDFVILQEHNKTLQQFPALMTPPLRASRTKKRGRPRNPSVSPRALLDAILWKLATGHTWDALPSEFPPMSLCRKYYRRLFLSGRLYTLLLALYNHMRLDACIDPYLLLEQGVFTTTPSQHIALSPQAAPTRQNYTALLFMQLARDAYLHFEREEKRNNPAYRLVPALKGEDELSNGLLPGTKDLHIPAFKPLNSSLAFKKSRQVEKREASIKKRLKTGKTRTKPGNGAR